MMCLICIVVVLPAGIGYPITNATTGNDLAIQNHFFTQFGECKAVCASGDQSMLSSVEQLVEK